MIILHGVLYFSTCATWSWNPQFSGKSAESELRGLFSPSFCSLAFPYIVHMPKIRRLMFKLQRINYPKHTFLNGLARRGERRWCVKRSVSSEMNEWTQDSSPVETIEEGRISCVVLHYLNRLCVWSVAVKRIPNSSNELHVNLNINNKKGTQKEPKHESWEKCGSTED